jgi:very-short-patch-repair endonuclease
MSETLSLKLQQSLQQWRDDLIDVGRRNPLINFRQSKTSTIDLSAESPNELLKKVASRKPSFFVGTSEEAAPAAIDENDLEALASAQEGVFDYSRYPDSLRVNRTQREVDRVLRGLASRASKTFIDKGINPLHLAIGGLSWVDENKDRQISPLMLLPARLARPGLRQPFALLLTEDDVVVNPALVIKLQQFGVVLPADSDVSANFENGGPSVSLDLFKSLDLPKTWEIVDLQALALFTFQKEAMYRDLLDNEAAILEHPIVSALGSGGLDLSAEFSFDPVDDSELDLVAPPELTPIILDADSSQRAAIHAAIEGQSFILDGPPGTGKSQTIANIIAGLIANGKTVLFVSEKVVALDVVKGRLAQRGLGSLVFELHSAKTTRKEVAKGLGEALNNRARVKPSLSEHEISKAREVRENLNAYAAAINEQREPSQLSLHDALGLIEKFGAISATPELEAKYSNLSVSDLESIFESADAMGKHWNLHLQGDKAFWSGLENQAQIAFNLQALETALVEFQNNYGALHKIAADLRLQGTFDFPNLLELLEKWSSGPADIQGREWLVDIRPEIIRDSLDRLEMLSRDLSTMRSKFESILGGPWELVPDHIPAVGTGTLELLSRAISGVAGVERKRISQLTLTMVEAAERLEVSANEVRDFCKAVGLSAPEKFADLEHFFNALMVAGSDEIPPAPWFESRVVANSLRKAARELEAAVVREIELEGICRVFKATVLDLDLRDFAAYFQQNNGFFNQFSGSYRHRRRALKANSVSTNWKQILGAVPSAFEWQQKRRQRFALESKHAELLGSQYIGLETNWPQLDSLLTKAEVMARGFEIEDAGKFSLELGSSKFPRLARALGELWSDFGSIQDRLKNEAGVGFTKEFIGLSFRESSDSLRNIADALKVVHDNLNCFEGTGKQETLKGVLTGLDVLAQFRLRRCQIESEILDHGEKLNTAFEVEDFLINSKGIVAGLKTRFDWTIAILELAAERTGASPLTLLDERQFLGLASSKIPPELSNSANAWAGAFDRFSEAFSKDRQLILRDQLREFDSARLFIQKLKSNLPEIDAWVELNRHTDQLKASGMSGAVVAAESLRLEPRQVSDFLKCCVLNGWVKSQIEADDRLRNQTLINRDDLIAQYRKLDKALADHAISQIVESAESRRPRSTGGQSRLIQREAEKGSRHKAVKDQISQASEVIKAIHPCFMMSPLSVSQYLPSDICFDVVIFDEASQVTPSDAINCIYRGRSLITAGDQKQLPPTRFFASMVSDDEQSEDDLTDFKSILDLMKGSGAFTSLTLRWHYRSRHEHLITFSNRAFYGGKLITFPGAIDESDDLGVKLFLVPDGIYRRSNGQDNPKEAMAVARRVMNHFSTRPDKSAGVVAFSKAQEDAITAAIAIERKSYPELDGFFDDAQTDRQTSFFVSNLESVQGDERDVIIFSVGYGPDEHGKIYKNFGPISRTGGERRLNVAFTRARELVEVVSSMSSSQLGGVSSGPAVHLKRYLDFAERGPSALMLEEGNEDAFPESPFEESVISEVRSWGYDVVSQVGAAGYRIDIGVVHPKAPGTFMLGVECDGAMYHSSRAARDRDRLRHEILEGLGWKIHHIWGTAWYRHRQGEIERLRDLLEDLSAQKPHGRLMLQVKPESTPVPVEFQRHETDDSYTWAAEYRRAQVVPLSPYLDLSDLSNARHLVALVTSVVETEQPVHIDVLAQRLREAADIGRVGNRIRATLDRAITLASVVAEGEFLLLSNDFDFEVRRPSSDYTREVDHIHPQELKNAVLGVTQEAIALEKDALINSVCELFGWTRRGARILAVLDSTINEMLAEAQLVLGSGGIRLPS